MSIAYSWMLFRSLKSLFLCQYLWMLSCFIFSTTFWQMICIESQLSEYYYYSKMLHSTVQENDPHPGSQTLPIKLHQQPEGDTDNYLSPYSRLLPLKFGNLITLNTLTWADFKGKVDKKLPWSAHIYWNIEYKLSNDLNPQLSVAVKVSHKSWVIPELKCDHLLSHQQGHLLIGYLCALEFVKRIHKSKVSPIYNQYVNNVFHRTLRQYQDLQRLYDEETDHRLNYDKQQEWDQFIQKRLLYFKSIFNAKLGKFGSLKSS